MTSSSYCRYSDFASSVFYLNQYETTQQVQNAINNIQYEGFYTNTADALRKMMNEQFVESRGDRPGVPNIGIVITGQPLLWRYLSAIASQITGNSTVNSRVRPG